MPIQLQEDDPIVEKVHDLIGTFDPVEATQKQIRLLRGALTELKKAKYPRKPKK